MKRIWLLALLSVLAFTLFTTSGCGLGFDREGPLVLTDAKGDVQFENRIKRSLAVGANAELRVQHHGWFTQPPTVHNVSSNNPSIVQVVGHTNDAIRLRALESGIATLTIKLKQSTVTTQVHVAKIARIAITLPKDTYGSELQEHDVAFLTGSTTDFEVAYFDRKDNPLIVEGLEAELRPTLSKTGVGALLQSTSKKLKITWRNPGRVFLKSGMHRTGAITVVRPQDVGALKFRDIHGAYTKEINAEPNKGFALFALEARTTHGRYVVGLPEKLPLQGKGGCKIQHGLLGLSGKKLYFVVAAQNDDQEGPCELEATLGSKTAKVRVNFPTK